MGSVDFGVVFCVVGIPGKLLLPGIWVVIGGVIAFSLSGACVDVCLHDKLRSISQMSLQKFLFINIIIPVPIVWLGTVFQ